MSQHRGLRLAFGARRSSTSASYVPEPTKEGEGKEDKQKAAEALGLDANGGPPHWSLSFARSRNAIQEAKERSGNLGVLCGSSFCSAGFEREFIIIGKGTN